MSNIKKILIASISVAVILLTGIFTLYPIIKNGPAVKIPANPAEFGPITVFGICPSQPEKVELLSENIVFTKDMGKAENIYGYYNVEMHYNIKLNGKAKFTLPFAHMNEDTAVQIFVDGVLADNSAATHSYASVKRPIIYSGSKTQSIHFLPAYNGLDIQPENSYEILMNTFENSSHELSLDTKFKVYNISDAKIQSDIDIPSFEVQGKIDDPMLLFVNGTCEINGFDLENLGKENQSSISRYYMGNRAGNSATKKWFSILADKDDLNVKIGNNTIPYKIMTLNEIITENLSINDNAKTSYMQKLNHYINNAQLGGAAYIVGDEAALNKSIAAHGMGFVDMFTFEITDPGEHHITVKLDATGESNLCKSYIIEFSDSPNHMWAKTEQRRLQININEKSQEYDITDKLFRFTEKK